MNHFCCLCSERNLQELEPAVHLRVGPRLVPPLRWTSENPVGVKFEENPSTHSGE